MQILSGKSGFVLNKTVSRMSWSCSCVVLYKCVSFIGGGAELKRLKTLKVCWFSLAHYFQIIDNEDFTDTLSVSLSYISVALHFAVIHLHPRSLYLSHDYIIKLSREDHGTQLSPQLHQVLTSFCSHNKLCIWPLMVRFLSCIFGDQNIFSTEVTLFHN